MGKRNTNHESHDNCATPFFTVSTVHCYKCCAADTCSDEGDCLEIFEYIQSGTIVVVNCISEDNRVADVLGTIVERDGMKICDLRAGEATQSLAIGFELPIVCKEGNEPAKQKNKKDKDKKKDKTVASMLALLACNTK